MEHTLSNKALIKSTIIAIIIAVIVLVSFILPAEYNIDPTGIGSTLDLTALATNDSTTTTVTPEKVTKNAVNEVIEVIVPAGRGVEYKFGMTQFTKMEYTWKTDGASLFFDLHGEPEGDTTGYFESYAIATLAEMKGSFTTPFTGVHGWYWKNTSEKPVTVYLTVSGEYSVIGLKQ